MLAQQSFGALIGCKRARWSSGEMALIRANCSFLGEAVLIVAFRGPHARSQSA
jgi:hypothetical protein